MVGGRVWWLGVWLWMKSGFTLLTVYAVCDGVEGLWVGLEVEFGFSKIAVCEARGVKDGLEIATGCSPVHILHAVYYTVFMECKYVGRLECVRVYAFVVVWVLCGVVFSCGVEV